MSSLGEIPPVALFVDRGKVTAREFAPRDGHLFVGYRSAPDADGFTVWERRGGLVQGFAEKTVRWFPSEEAAQAWILARINEASKTGSERSDLTENKHQQTTAA
ncbi:MAG: hypothetical protein HOP18_11260 [Deltaproteobacteria bacterium]|nr:hypothetical protein [Deltaproteobacteria bacterium]